jgi:uncharacterized membrane protein (DUF485 family)
MNAADADARRIVAWRWRLAGGLTVAMMVVYFGFILLVAFAKPTMGALVTPGLSLGILLGAAVIAFACVLTGFYVRWANRVYDPAVATMRATSRRARDEAT